MSGFECGAGHNGKWVPKSGARANEDQEKSVPKKTAPKTRRGHFQSSALHLALCDHILPFARNADLVSGFRFEEFKNGQICEQFRAFINRWKRNYSGHIPGFVWIHGKFTLFGPHLHGGCGLFPRLLRALGRQFGACANQFHQFEDHEDPRTS